MKELTDEGMTKLVYKDKRLFKLWQASKLDIEDYIDIDFKLIQEIANERVDKRDKKRDKSNNSRE
jgi:hypothetical protein